MRYVIGDGFGWYEVHFIRDRPLTINIGRWKMGRAHARRCDRRRNPGFQAEIDGSEKASLSESLPISR